MHFTDEHVPGVGSWQACEDELHCLDPLFSQRYLLVMDDIDDLADLHEPEPGGLGKATGGQGQYIEAFARAGVACGVDAVFMEVHDDPSRAPSDGPNQLPLARLESLLIMLKQIHDLTSSGRSARAEG